MELKKTDKDYQHWLEQVKLFQKHLARTNLRFGRAIIERLLQIRFFINENELKTAL